MTTKIQYISDIHLEFYKKLESLPQIAVTSDILVLAGDIGYPTTTLYWDFLEQQASRFKHILLITGNHEYYHTQNAIKKGRVLDIHTIDELIASELKRRELTNIHFLHSGNQFVIIDKVCFIGTTLWSHIPDEAIYEVSHRMNDYRNIFIKNGDGSLQNIIPSDVNVLHLKQKDDLIHTLVNTSKSNTIEKIVVITHHLPSFELIHPKYQTDELKELNSAFACDILDTLDDELKAKIDLWICGHTHSPESKVVNGVQCVINPIGYPGENKLANWDTPVILV
jgi:predicted phosphodiesterase